MVVAGVDLEAGRDVGRKRVDEVEPADLDGALADFSRERVDRPLDRVGRLGPARAAVGVRRRRVREHARAVEVVGVDGVAAGVKPRAEQRHARRDGLEVRAHRRGQPRADSGDLALGRGGELDLLDHVAPVDRRQVPLGALLGPLDRAAELAGERDHDHVLGVHVELGAEAAADVRRDHADLRLGHAEDERVGGAHDVRPLRRGRDRDVAGRVHLAERGARLHRGRDQPLLAVALLDRHGRVREDLVRFAGDERPRVRLVAGRVVVNGRRTVGNRQFDVGHVRQRLVVDLDELGRVLGLSARLGHDDRDAVAGEPRLVDGEREVLDHRDVVGHGPEARQAVRPDVREIGAGKGGDDAGSLARLRHVDACDRRVRIRAADDDRVHHARRSEVVGVRALAGEKAGVLLARDGGADRRHAPTS